MSETEEINSGMLKAQDLSYHSPKQWFQNKLATARIPPATWLYVAGSPRPLLLQGPCGPSVIVTSAYFSRVSHLLQNILKPLQKGPKIISDLFL